jgi:hypothetical protein
MPEVGMTLLNAILSAPTLCSARNLTGLFAANKDYHMAIGTNIHMTRKAARL